MNSQQIGRIGQKKFGLICSEAGLIVNESLEDAAGWDFLVQFHLDDNFAGTLDKRPPSISAYFQVKTSLSDADYVEVKATNAERMVTDNIPVFFAIGKLRQSDLSVRFIIGHVGGEAIAFVLKQLRAIPQHQYAKLNRRKLRIPVKYLEIAAVNDSQDVIITIKKYVPNDVRDYIYAKNQIVETAGYGPDAYSGSFSLSGSDPGDKLIALMIGEIDEIEVTNFKITERRFGIEREEISLEGGVLKIETNNNIEATVIVSNIKSQLFAEYKAKLRLPSIPGLPFEKFRMRVEAEVFSFSIGSSQGLNNWRFKPDWDRHKTWLEVKNDLNLIEMLSFGESSINCFVGANQILEGTVAGSSADQARLEYFHATIRAIDNIAKYPNISVVLKFSLREFESLLRLNRALIYMIADGKSKKINITTTINKRPSMRHSHAKFVFPLVFQCGGKVIAAAVFAEGAVKIRGKIVKMTVSDTHIKLPSIFDSESLAINYLRLGVRRIADELPDDDFIVVQEGIWQEKSESTHLLALG